jgi:hypothetical protein
MWWWADLEFDDFVDRLSRRKPADELPGEFRVLKMVRRALAPKGRTYGELRNLVVNAVFFCMIVLSFFRLALEISQKKVQPSLARVPKIVFTSEDVEWRYVIDEETGQIRKSDVFFDSIMRKLVAGYECIGVYPILRRKGLGPFLRGLRIARDKAHHWYVEHRPFDLYWSLDARKAERDAYEHFKKIWSDLLRDAKFIELCDHARKSMGPSVVSMLEYYFLHTFPAAVCHIAMAEHMIRKESPDLILLEEEYGTPFERALLVAAKRNRVPTLAVQHGDIHPYHPGYVSLRGQVSPEGSVDSPFCPIPDKTAVYGPYHRDFLTEIGYPQGSVDVTGQPRYDRLYHAHEIYSTEAFRERYGIGLNQRIVLWATQCHCFSAQENIDYMTVVFEAMQEVTGATLIIKQHPGERDIHTRMISECLADYRIKAVLTPKDSDTFEQLYVSDMLITTYSTTATEAVALGKPVIILNLSERPESTDYVAQGVAIGIREKDQLAPAIVDLLRDASRLSSNRQRFIEQYLYRIDGEATQRIVKLISAMIEDRTHENATGVSRS